MKWILIFVLYSHTAEAWSSTSGNLNTTVTTMLFDDERACQAAREGLSSGAFNRSFSGRSSESKVVSDAACVPQASINGRGPIR